MANFLEPDISTRLLRVTTAFNDVLYSCANEPSLGMYRIQEHVAVTVPKLVEQRRQLKETCQRVEDACYDLEYDAKTLTDMAKITQFSGVKQNLLRAIELHKKLDELEIRKRTSYSPIPAASLPVTKPQPAPPSLPPHTLTQTTPTNQTPGTKDDVSDSDTSTDITGDLTADSQNLVPDMGIRPKTFN